MGRERPAAASILVTFPDGERLPLIHLRKEHLRSIDMLIHRIESGFGYATLKIAQGRIAGYDVFESVRVIDELATRPPAARPGAA